MVLYTDYDKALEHLQDWIKSQPHLPQNIDPNFLRKFITVYDGDLEKSKKLIDLQWTLRNAHSHIFLERDPLSQNTLRELKISAYYHFPDVTPKGHHVFLNKVAESDKVDSYNFNESVKALIMLYDTFIQKIPVDSSNGFVQIYDMNGFTLRHLTKWSLSTVRIFAKFGQEALALNIREIHVINTTPFIDKIMTLLKPFLKTEVYNMIHFHPPKSETLYEFVPKDMLPNEYGGKAGSEENMRQVTLDDMKKYRDWLMDPKQWIVDESRRPANQERPDAMEGNFKKLNFD